MKLLIQNIPNKLLYIAISFCLFTSSVYASLKETCPFSVNSTNLTVWNGEEYIPINIKGINLGVALPGKFPSELTPTYEMYYNWFEMIREAGFNTIRLYTLHYPRFYKALRDYNLANPQSPLLILHGVWLEEELDGYESDLFYLKDVFTQEIHDNINCIHGNNTIDFRYGKAYGTYDTDISPWVLGYIIGREVSPDEILTTNTNHSELTTFSGQYLSIDNVNASEVFVTSMLEEAISYEQTNYQTQRPVSFSSWPTLDPLEHPGETTTDEDIASLELATMDFSNAPAGFFISYHAYPYYPDFISKEDTYTSYTDYLGQNSYLGYLTHLKDHYEGIPLIVAEFGVPSSWGVAHYAQSGMNHGGFDEWEQGDNNIRMYGNIMEAGCGGGIMFAWIDEWFKRTWITDPMDFLMNRRIIWQNITAAEQNFGLIGFQKTDDNYSAWTTDCSDCWISNLEVDADFKFLKTRFKTKDEFGMDDTLWVGIDTYDASLGESILPNGKTLSNRAEFALMITAYKAELYVTEAYDLYGIWFYNVATEKQLFHSVASDGDSWNIVRWKNNEADNNVQYIGSMQVNRLNLPQSSLDAVRIYEDSIEIRLPWTLLNFVDPSTFRVMNDDRSTPDRELAESDGIAMSFFYKNEQVNTTERYLWPAWNHAENTNAYKKTSYEVVKNELHNFKGALIASTDSFTMKASGKLIVGSENSLTSNDFNFDGGDTYLSVVDNPQKGILSINEEGEFTYIPDELFAGVDQFSYRLYSGINRSEIANVKITVEGTPSENMEGFINISPNPSNGIFYYESGSAIDMIEIYDANGKLFMNMTTNDTSGTIDLSNYPSGHYFAKFHSNNDMIVKRLLLVK